MIVNKKALYALAAYYDAINLESVATKAERVDLIEMFIPCIKSAFNERELELSILHGEKFFDSRTSTVCESAQEYEATYINRFNDRNIAKLLRYIARTGKFPAHKSLKYV